MAGMVVPCPRFDDLVQHGAALARDLPTSALQTKIILTSHPDGSVTESRSTDTIEVLVTRLKKNGFPPTADGFPLWFGDRDVVLGAGGWLSEFR